MILKDFKFFVSKFWLNPTPTRVGLVAVHSRCVWMRPILQSSEFLVTGDQWPIFLYHGYSYDPDDPWDGLLRSALLISVSFHSILCFPLIVTLC
jgi:hypothetical protein